MANISLDKFRNIGIMAHIDAGKPRRRSVSFSIQVFRTRSAKFTEGTATMDWMEQEQERGITITSAATTCFWKRNGVSTALTSSIHRATLTSRWKSNVRFAFSTVRSQFLTE